MTRAARTLVGFLTAVATLGVGAASEPAAAVATRPPVVLIVLENHSFGRIVGNRSARYLNRTFIPSGTLFTNYHAIAHPSLPNYLAMTSGTTAGCTSDACPVDRYRANNVFHQLSTSGRSWRAYEESMPSRCALAYTSLYSRHHNPPPYYTNLMPTPCSRHDVPYPSRLPSRLARFTFVTPNVCHDMHSCSVRRGDRWLSRQVPRFLRRGAIVVIVFDEGSGSNRVMTAEVGPGIAAGVEDGRHYSHYGLLAGLERYFGLRRLRHARGVRPLPI